MTYRVRTLRRARFDVDAILDWIAIQREAPEGAATWLDAYEATVAELAERPQSYSLAPEDEHVDYELRQFLFKTRRGRTYRGVFTIVGEENTPLASSWTRASPSRTRRVGVGTRYRLNKNAGLLISAQAMSCAPISRGFAARFWASASAAWRCATPLSSERK